MHAPIIEIRPRSIRLPMTAPADRAHAGTANITYLLIRIGWINNQMAARVRSGMMAHATVQSIVAHPPTDVECRKSPANRTMKKTRKDRRSQELPPREKFRTVEDSRMAHCRYPVDDVFRTRIMFMTIGNVRIAMLMIATTSALRCRRFCNPRAASDITCATTTSPAKK